MTVAAAEAALAKGDVRTAIAELVTAWREVRAPELAQTIDEVAAMVPKDSTANAADVGGQLAAKLPRSVDKAVIRLRELVELDDPRVVSYLHVLLEAPPFGQAKFWKAALELLVVARDPRSIEFLGDLKPRLPAIARPSELVRIERYREDAYDDLIARFIRGDPSLDAKAAAALAAIRARLDGARAAGVTAGKPGAELVAAIRANPTDDRPRLVYADWLQQRGDPRGEFIALQLAGDSKTYKRRESALLKEHGAMWLGPLANVAVIGRCRFARGFPVAVAVNARTAAQLAPVVGVDEWWSVEELELSGAHVASPDCGNIVLHPCMTALRSVRGLGSEPANRIASSESPLPLTTLGVTIAFGDTQLETCNGLPQLEHLVLETLVWVIVTSTFIELASAPVATRLKTLTLATKSCAVSLCRDRAGRLAKLRVTIETMDNYAFGDVERIVDSRVPLSELEVVTPARFASEAELSRVLARVWHLPRTITVK